MKLTILNILMFLAVSLLFALPANAQNEKFGTFGTSLPWDDPADYLYNDEASLFWNMHYRPGRGILGINLGEYWQFESQDDSYNPETHGGDVFDYWTGVFVGGVVYKGFLLKLEGGTENHQVRPSGEDAYHRYNWGMSFAVEASSGIALTKISSRQFV